MDALYERDGDHVISTELTAGPWDRRAQHGGAPSALFAHVIDAIEAPTPMRIARLTVELLRPVPVARLRLTTDVFRTGKKVQLAGASLWADETEVARGVGLQLRVDDLPVPPAMTPTPVPPGPTSGRASEPPWSRHIEYTSFHQNAVEHRFVDGTFDQPGPARDWIRLRVPVVAGQRVSPMSRVAAAADFGNGIGWELSREDGWTFINPDLTMYVHHYPTGEWVCLDSQMYADGTGIGLAESRLFDEERVIGRSLQSLLIDRV